MAKDGTPHDDMMEMVEISKLVTVEVKDSKNTLLLEEINRKLDLLLGEKEHIMDKPAINYALSYQKFRAELSSSIANLQYIFKSRRKICSC
ncbi:hypothetical protein [Peptoniphilus asaccharolyticus]